MVDFRSDPSESAEGKGIARRAWDAYASGLRRSTRPVFDPVAAAWSRKLTEDLIGPDSMHRQLVEWLAMLGLRTQTAVADELTHAAAELEAGEPIPADFAAAAGDDCADAADDFAQTANNDFARAVDNDFAQAAGNDFAPDGR